MAEAKFLVAGLTKYGVDSLAPNQTGGNDVN